MKSSPTNTTKILYPSTVIKFIPILFQKNKPTNSNGIHSIKCPPMFIQTNSNLFSLAPILGKKNLSRNKIRNYSNTVFPLKK